MGRGGEVAISKAAIPGTVVWFQVRNGRRRSHLPWRWLSKNSGSKLCRWRYSSHAFFLFNFWSLVNNFGIHLAHINTNPKWTMIIVHTARSVNFVLRATSATVSPLSASRIRWTFATLLSAVAVLGRPAFGWTATLYSPSWNLWHHSRTVSTDGQSVIFATEIGRASCRERV